MVVDYPMPFANPIRTFFPPRLSGSLLAGAFGAGVFCASNRYRAPLSRSRKSRHVSAVARTARGNA
jgi:hypothetical protein